MFRNEALGILRGSVLLWCVIHFVVADEEIVYSRWRYHPPPFEVDGFLAPVKYHATVLLQKNTVMTAPLSSACMKCGICIVVSEKLDQILDFALKSSISLEDFDQELSSHLLRPICDYAFHSYGLKEWEGLRFISQYPFLENVPNSLEGHWSDVLQSACHFYLNHFGEDNLVKMWLYESRLNITSLLCRNNGIFRDCENIDQGVITIQFPSRFLFPANCVQINYACA
ncbi:UNVERIFIED_CONTAM: hypothetical protein PYX00_002831 [Menopon gallinae]|uniref:Uncharacterized protein n=1 Tax=Menopon gallinae TaxID=328185 RepID=A0AAW2HYZ5_9NEOP